MKLIEICCVLSVKSLSKLMTKYRRDLVEMVMLQKNCSSLVFIFFLLLIIFYLLSAKHFFPSCGFITSPYCISDATRWTLSYPRWMHATNKQLFKFSTYYRKSEMMIMVNKKTGENWNTEISWMDACYQQTIILILFIFEIDEMMIMVNEKIPIGENFHSHLLGLCILGFGIISMISKKIRYPQHHLRMWKGKRSLK